MPEQSWWDRTKSAWRVWRGKNGESSVNDYPDALIPDNPRLRYQLLDLVYDNSVYREIRSKLPQIARPNDFHRIKALENPAIQAVDFHVMHAFPGPLEEAIPLAAREEVRDPKGLVDAAYRILRWSNFERKKRPYTEWQGKYGDVFLKPSVPESEDRVYLQLRKPEDVTRYEEDSEGRITYARLDVELPPDPAEIEANYKANQDQEWWTEEWDLEADSYRAWQHKRGLGASLNELGRPVEEWTLTSRGISYIPLVRAPFGDSGDERSWGVFEKWIEAIDEINRQATELRNRYFRYGKHKLVFLRNEQGQPAINVNDRRDDRPSPRRGTTEEDREQAAENDAMFMPGVSDVKSLVPDIDYQAGLNQIEASKQGIEDVLSELRFFRGHDRGDPSAAALRIHIAPAISRGLEARGNAEAALLEALRMCIDIGSKLRIFRPELNTTFEEAAESSGANPLMITERALVPESATEKAERESLEAIALRDIKALGIPELLEKALIDRGFSEADAERIAREASQASTGIPALDLFGGFGANGNQNGNQSEVTEEEEEPPEEDNDRRGATV